MPSYCGHGWGQTIGEEEPWSPEGPTHTGTPLSPGAWGRGEARGNLDLVRALGHGALREMPWGQLSEETAPEVELEIL